MFRYVSYSPTRNFALDLSGLKSGLNSLLGMRKEKSGAIFGGLAGAGLGAAMAVDRGRNGTRGRRAALGALVGGLGGAGLGALGGHLLEKLDERRRHPKPSTPISSVSIYAQSLQNDDNPDLYFNGRYRTDRGAVSWEDVMRPLHERQQAGRTRYEGSNVKYRIDPDGYSFVAPSVERDVAGRLSEIESLCPTDQRDQFPAAMKEFLSKSGRSLSPEDEKAIEAILKMEHKRRWF